MSSLKPLRYTPLPPSSPDNNTKKLQFPLLPGMNKSVQLPCFTPGTPTSILFKGNITPAKKTKPISSELTGRHKKADKSPENIFLSPVIVHNHIL